MIVIVIKSFFYVCENYITYITYHIPSNGSNCLLPIEYTHFLSFTMTTGYNYSSALLVLSPLLHCNKYKSFFLELNAI